MTREARIFRALTTDLWVTERAQRFLAAEMGTRMTVIRLADGGLFIHSPVALGNATRAELATLGPVRHVVAPNRYHHLYVAPYLSAYPEAQVYAAPGLPEKRRDLRFHEVLSDDAPAAWAGQIDQLVFRPLPILNEVVFFHRPSRTLIVCDLVTNVERSSSPLTRLFFWLDDSYGKLGAGRLWRLLIRDRPAARGAIDHILSWDFDRIIMAHGNVLETGGCDAFRAGFAWLFRS